MFLELIAVIVAGLAGAGGMLLLTKLARGRLPRWLVPVAAGCAMLAAAISSEYGWYGRTSEALPEGLVVADRIDRPSWYRPWTYLVPMTQRFVAVDIDNLQQNTEQASVFLADLYFFGRWRAVQSVEIMVDCAAGLRADPTFGDGSAPVWREVGASDPIVSSICARV
ncbi:hypothetical protein FIU97_09645 [Roseivivax sp. THAF40]|uniref:hypothetical protein n=1 Tax=unclassified Roseivivax TaxID=2639302 RepID=UPI0012687C53|nr:MULTISPECIES: hypothetical protein [unclassified Roseivivax]QFS83090.1 hypothetical protein FIV09_09660 [Roseivivax sp. THAF197b]QFT46834.1 hypothetical protein FIU97_09645 [Roseivivax sp. THAF40]